MNLATAYYIVLLIWLVFGAWSNWPNLRAGGGNLLMFVLFVLIGVKLFGPPIHT